MNQKEFYSLLKSVPKAEIHLHIEAVPTIKTIKTLYKKRFDKEMTDNDVTELFSYEDLNGFIQAFLKIQDLFTCEDDLNFVFDDLEEYLVEGKARNRYQTSFGRFTHFRLRKRNEELQSFERISMRRHHRNRSRWC